MAGNPVSGIDILVAPLLATAILASGWMTIKQRGSQTLPGCGSGSGCHSAAKSRWSRLGKLPVAALGTIIYVLTLLLWIDVRIPIDRFASVSQQLLVSFALLIAGAGIWFTVLQMLVLRRLCIYCTMIHVLAIAAAILIFRTRLSSAGVSLGAILSATAAVLSLIALQIIIKPKMYALQATGETVSAGEGTAKGSQPGVQLLHQPTVTASPPLARPARPVALLSGREVLSANDWPYTGTDTASHILALLFDYSCLDCRHLHRLLRQARERYRGQLAIIDIPVPMSPSCNPGIKPRNASHPYACAYARLGLAISAAAPMQYEQYATWFFEDQEVPPLGVARQEASRLAGAELYDPNAPDPQLDAQLQLGRGIYQRLETPSIPALLLHNGVLQGRVTDLRELLGILQKQLGPPR